MKGHGNNGRDRLAGAVLRSQPDTRLVDLVREGHERAFDEIVRRYRSSLVSFAGGIVPGHYAEDVVQEALSKAHGAMDGGDAEINLRPWLYTIVRNRALNALRDQPVHDHLDESFDGVPQPPEVVARREELAALTSQVKGLPDPQRDAIVKRELEGRSHEEIASSLGVSAGAVRGLIYRARATLRDGMGLLIPIPALRLLLNAASANPEPTGSAGAAAAIAAGGGGGIAVKAGATLGVAVIAVGSGFAIQHRSANPDGHPQAARSADQRSAHGRGGGGPGASDPAGEDRSRRSGHEGPGSGGSGGEGSSSGPGSGGHSGSDSSGEGSGRDGAGHAGDSGPSGGAGNGGSGNGASGRSRDGGGESSIDADAGGSSGSGSSGSGSGDGGEETTATPSSDDGGGTSGKSG